VASPDSQEQKELDSDIYGCFIISHRRTDRQDPISAVHQLVDVALRALSPSLNDPFTAVACIDWLGAAMAKVMRRTLPARHRYDQEGRLRVVLPGEDLDSMLAAAFNGIRQAAGAQTVVSEQMIETLGRLGPMTRAPSQRSAIRTHVEMTYRQAMRSAKEPGDEARLTFRYEAALARLEDSAAAEAG
jgi:uncharacterized membrane protein